MTNRDSNSWLEAVFVDAQDSGWCVRPYCTTCGCLEFRRTYWAVAAQQVGMRITQDESTHRARGFLKGFSNGEREAIVQSLVAGLRQLSPQWSDSEAFRAIIIDLDPPFLKCGVPMVLDAELSATPAGEALERIREHAKWLRAEREEFEAYDSPEAVEERKRVKQEEKARAYTLRQSQKCDRDAERLDLLASLARLPVSERLSQFAMDPELKLGLVSPELIPAQESDIVDLERATAVALIARIDRRKGKWGRLRRLIEHRFKLIP